MLYQVRTYQTCRNIVRNKFRNTSKDMIVHVIALVVPMLELVLYKCISILRIFSSINIKTKKDPFKWIYIVLFVLSKHTFRVEYVSLCKAFRWESVSYRYNSL